MSKINTSSKGNSISDVRLAGGAGGYAAKQTNINALRRCTLACLLWEDNAYVDGKSVADHISTLVPLCDPEDVFNLVLETRQVQKLRHTPLFLISEMCRYNECASYVRKALRTVITRADMLTDFLAIYWKEDENRKLTAQAKRGLADAFHNFDEYQFAKYDRDNEYKLRDVMRIAHPKATSQEENELFARVNSRKLATPDTWEVALSSGKDKKETWTRLITEHKLGGKAMLMNISNMMSAGVDKEVIENGLRNIHGSMLLPLDYLKAAKHAPEFKNQISEAMVRSYKNLPKLPGRTLFIVDESGSMTRPISNKSTFDRMSAARSMAMLAANQCEHYDIVLTAGDDETLTHASVELKYPSTGLDMIDMMENLHESERLGTGGIFTRQCLDWCKEHFEGVEYDRIIVFSDSQDVDDYYDKKFGRRKILPHPYGKKNYICDVSAELHGINFNGVWTAEISGWSEHFLTYIAAAEGLENTFQE